MKRQCILLKGSNGDENLTVKFKLKNVKQTNDCLKNINSQNASNWQLALGHLSTDL